jgi:hypothetical protein
VALVLTHVVTFIFLPDTTDAQIDALTDALRALPSAIDEIADYRVGRDAGLSAGNAAFAVVASFATEADYLVYRDHPAHQALIQAHVLPIMASRSAAQIRS